MEFETVDTLVGYMYVCILPDCLPTCLPAGRVWDGRDRDRFRKKLLIRYVLFTYFLLLPLSLYLNNLWKKPISPASGQCMYMYIYLGS